MLEILNLEKLINFSRRLIFYNFDDKEAGLSDNDFLKKVSKIEHQDMDEIEDLLPFEECKVIFKEFIKQKKNKKTKQIKYVMIESDYDNILSMLNQRMISNIIKNLVNKGVLESAFDNEKNDFVFWVNNNDKTE